MAEQSECGEFEIQHRGCHGRVPIEPGERAIRGGEEARSNFANYAGPLTEVILLGNLAVWAADQGGVGKKIEWDAKNLKVTNLSSLSTAGVADLIKPNYAEGHRLD